VSFAASFPGFRLRPTRWGLVYLAGCFVLGMAAVNTGNNALMAMLGLGLGSYVVSGLWSRQVLGSLEVTVRPPPDIFAGRPAVLELELVNRSRLFPAYGVLVRDADGRVLVREPLVPPGGRSRHPLQLVFAERGWQRPGPWRLEVLLPLGFFLKSKTLAVEQQVLVFPRLLAGARAPLRRGGGRRGPDALEARGREGEVLSLRGFREGDELRALHWKQTARQQSLVVVERQRAAERPVIFVVDPRLEDPDDEVQLAAFERLVSEVATGVVHRLREGVSVGLIVGRVVVPPMRSARRAPALLKPLAEVRAQPASAPPPAEAMQGRRVLHSLAGRAR